MTQDIKEHHEEEYLHYAYQALGRYYSNRGNYELSEQHYRHALELTDSAALPETAVDLHLALAEVTSNTNPQRALDYLNHIGDMPKTVRQQGSILAQKCLIYDKMGRWDDFSTNYRQYDSLRNQHPAQIVAPEYNKVMVSKYVHEGNYLHALAQVDYMTKKTNQLAMHVKIYKAMQKWDLAFAQQEQLNSIERRLRTEALMESLDDLNDELRNQEEKEKHIEARQRQLVLVGLMLFTIILQLLVLLSYRRMSHKRLKQHYKELNEARQHTRDALAIRQAFVNTMAEQLKTPISSLFHYARLMNSPNCPFDHEQRIHVLTEIKGAARTIDRMLNPVLSSYINKSEGISDEHKLRCQEALRSPLHALIGLTELASEGMDNNISEDDMTSMRYTMSNEAFMVAMATQQIILFSATDEYTEIPRPDHIALNEMVQSLVSDYDLRNQSLTKKFESSIIDDVAIQTDQTIPTIRKESESLSQASNSIKNVHLSTSAFSTSSSTMSGRSSGRISSNLTFLSCRPSTWRANSP